MIAYSPWVIKRFNDLLFKLFDEMANVDIADTQSMTYALQEGLIYGELHLDELAGGALLYNVMDRMFYDLFA